MNTPSDIRWLMFATVPTHGYINLATPIGRGFVWLWRRAAQVGPGTQTWAATLGGATAPSAGTVQVPERAGHPCPE